MKIVKSLKNSFQSFLAQNDILLHKKTPLNSEDKIIEYLLKTYGIDLVLDIGANIGQFALELLTAHFKGDIISFEPLPDVFQQLHSNAVRYPNWRAENLALGAETGEIRINVAGNTESSSILPMLSAHSDLAPESRYIDAITVPITTLDNYLQHQNLAKRNTFLKIDVQGYEESVLNGAVHTLEHVKILQLELSFIPLYDSSLLYYKMMEKIEAMGFSFYSLFPAFSDYKTGQIFQIDAIFVRNQEVKAH
ncbi:FkbM family methyltransferase [Paraflavisolibacter sp. H34]|uniref:FkbM family methyltransferase n=1 Tax=Huijunlia imazamoxiresistens TaxID=3127457 RepID=UPI003015F130